MTATATATVRQATVGDVRAIIDMGHALCEESRVLDEDDLDAEHLETVLREVIPEGGVFVAEACGRLVGVLAACLAMRFWTGERYVQDLGWYVDREHRGTGLAGQLVQAVERWAFAADVRDVTIGVSSGLPMAEKLLTRMGYVRCAVAYRKLL